MFRNQTCLHLLFLICLCYFLFFFRLGDRSLTSSHEARAAQNAQSMLLNNDWLLPQLFDRQADLQKPPLYYWLVAIIGMLFGGNVDSLVVRLPSACSAMGCVFLVYGLGLLRKRPLAGFLAAIMLATFIHFTWLARVARIDMVLTFSVTLSLFAFYLGRSRLLEQEEAGIWKIVLPGYLALAAGLLLKGPVALVLVGVVGVCGLILRRPKESAENMRVVLQRLGFFWGIPLAFGIAIPWFLIANQYTGGDQFYTFFWYHNLARGIGNAKELAVYPWWYYFPRLLLDLLPWSLFFPVILFFHFRRKEFDPLANFGFVWIVGIFGFFSLMSFKRADYLLPMYPGMALFLGCGLERLILGATSNQPLRFPAKFYSHLGWGIVFSLVAGWMFFICRIIPEKDCRNPNQKFAELIRQSTNKPVLFFRTEAHDVAFHVGPPQETLLEWENLKVWLNLPYPVYVVMPPEVASLRAKFLPGYPLQEVMRTTDLSQSRNSRPLVLLKKMP